MIPLESLLARTESITESGCWIWMGEVSKSHGYAIISSTLFVGKRRDYAHREMYRRFKGEIPDGLTIDHLCRVRCCVNPYHLEVVTRGENVLRGESLIAENGRKTHCKYGHLLDGDNLYRVTTRPTTRVCRTCKRRIDREGYARRAS